MKITFALLQIETEGPNFLTRLSWARRSKQVKKRDEETCQYCGELAPDGQADHIIPLSRGGTDALNNLAWACKHCNFSKGARMLGSEWNPPPEPLFQGDGENWRPPWQEDGEFDDFLPPLKDFRETQE